DVAIDDRIWSQLDTLLRVDVTIDGSTNDADGYIDLGIDARRVIHDESSFVGKDFARDIPVDAQHVFESDLAIEFRLFFRVGSRTLLDGECAAGSQASRNDSIDRQHSAVMSLAGDDRHSRLEAGFLGWAKRSDLSVVPRNSMRSGRRYYGATKSGCFSRNGAGLSRESGRWGHQSSARTISGACANSIFVGRNSPGQMTWQVISEKHWLRCGARYHRTHSGSRGFWPKARDGDHNY